MSETCHYCGRPATKLCDGVIGWLSFDGRLIATDEPDPAATCDRPLCEACAAASSPWFLDGTTEDGEHWGEIGTDDYCPGCVREGRQFGSLGAPLVDRAALARLRADRLEGAAPARSPLTLVAPSGHE